MLAMRARTHTPIRMNQFNVLNPDGSKTPICYPTKISLNQVVLGKRVGGCGLLLDVELEVTARGWIAKSRAGTVIVAERAGKIRDKSQFIV